MTGSLRLGYAITGSFCTVGRSLAVLRRLVAAGHSILPVMSENAFYTDTRFGRAEDVSGEVERICGRGVIHTVEGAEPLGPTIPLDALVVAPCTGNTLAKVAAGITDTSVTMAMKAHLRCDRPLLVALATNDAMSQNLGNIGRLLSRKSVFFVPMEQDSPLGKPHSLVAKFELIPECLDLMMRGVQKRPVFLEPDKKQ